jgi:putative membrane protein
VKWGWGWGEPFWIVAGVVTSVAFWILIVVAIVALVRRRPGEGSYRHRSTALELLEDRYARGEIDRDEFLERRAVLTEGGRGGPQSPGRAS